MSVMSIRAMDMLSCVFHWSLKIQKATRMVNDNRAPGVTFVESLIDRVDHGNPHNEYEGWLHQIPGAEPIPRVVGKLNEEATE